MMSPGVSTTPSKTFNSPASDNWSGSGGNKEGPIAFPFLHSKPPFELEFEKGSSWQIGSRRSGLPGPSNGLATYPED